MNLSKPTVIGTVFGPTGIAVTTSLGADGQTVVIQAQHFVSCVGGRRLEPAGRAVTLTPNQVLDLCLSLERTCLMATAGQSSTRRNSESRRKRKGRRGLKT